MDKRLSISQLLITLSALVIILAGIKLASEIVVPFLLSLFIAIICSPVVKFMTERKIPHWLALTLLFLMILTVFFFLVSLINSTAKEFTQSIPQYRVLFSQRLNDLSVIAQGLHLPVEDLREKIMDNFDPAMIMNFASGFLLSFSGVVTNVFVLFLVVLFMLLEAPTAKHKFAVALSKADDVAKYEGSIDLILKGVMDYLGVKTFTSFVTGLGVFILLKILGVQYAILWATLSFLLNYVPNIGSIIAAVPIIIQALLLNGFFTGIGVMIGVVSLNMIIGNVLEPKMMGKSLGLSTLIVFLSLLFWGWLLGSVGMFLSVPLTMVLKIALEASPDTIKYAALLGETPDSKA
ncbi:AI-2E family transporter [Avibacterium sp. 21-586]|uniref:AI-2E family transporter n=1 Tax=Avibacterium sp. 21-586 TaxID=2911534 RepID=UPI002247ED95|nr:AI-2E family transporter [Avibacterium sp. 21-586]MCW9710038.1 AI-2E family transporter [Avibacterium sp. 21-586]